MDKTPISIALERQIPEFIREEYGVFVDFIKAYYAFLDQTQQRNLEDIRSIENTLDEFVTRFKKELSVIFPTNTLENERFILQRIREFYKTRGSTESFQFLFRTLFNKEAEIYYPSKQILRASDGSWIQERSLFIQQSSGDLFHLGGKIINIKTDMKNIHVFCPRVVHYRENIYEVFIDRSYIQDIFVGNPVLSEDGLDTGVIIPCPSKYNIITSGSGFEIGSLYHLPSESGNGSLVKITKIDANGGIKKIQVITFGLDYESVFYAKLSNKTRQAFSYYTPITSFTLGAGHPAGLFPTSSYTTTNPYADGTTGYIDLGYINKQDYFAYDSAYVPAGNTTEKVFYADGTYVGEIIGSFYTNNSNDSVIDNTLAEIRIDLGPVAVYPGYYSKSDGFISDESFIQDGKYYQLFSYVIKVEQQIESYRDIIKALLHPAGFEMFAEYNIKNTYLVSASALNAFIRRQFTDQQYATDDDAANDVYKFLSELQSTYHSDTQDIKDVIKRLENANGEFQTILESKYYDMLKGSAGDPIENSLAPAYHDITADIKDNVKNTSDITAIPTDYGAGSKKDALKGSAGDPIENSLAPAYHVGTQDIKDTLKGSASDPVENSLVPTYHVGTQDIKDNTKLSTDVLISPTDYDTGSKKDNTKLTSDTTGTITDYDTGSKKDALKGSAGDPIENSLAPAYHVGTQDIKDSTKLTSDTTGIPTDAIGNRDVVGAGIATYVRDTNYSNFNSLPEQYPFVAATITAEAIGNRDAAGKGIATYSRDKTYVNYTGETNPFDSYFPIGENGSAKDFTPSAKTDAIISVGGDWSWDGSAYVMNYPETRIGVGYIRTPNIIGFQATLVAGSTTVTLTSGTTSGLYNGIVLSLTSGTGVFGTGARILAIIDATSFTVTISHVTSGSVVFSTIGDTSQLGEALSSPTDTFPDGSTQGLTKWSFSGASWDQTQTIADAIGTRNGAGQGSVTYDRSIVPLATDLTGVIADTFPDGSTQGLTKWSFSGASWSDLTGVTIDSTPTRANSPIYADSINNTNTGTLYYNVYNQNDAADPNTSYSYEAEVYSVHDMRAIS